MIKNTVYLLVFFTCCFIFTHYAAADEFQKLTADELKEKIDSGENLFLLNPLSDLEFNEGHIPGSVNIPYTAIMKTDKLPKNKNTLIVIYCLGIK